jgi:hypothetical protein
MPKELRMPLSDDAWICELNIERFRSRLMKAIDGRERAVFSRLLADEQAKLDRLTMNRERHEPSQ